MTDKMIENRVNKLLALESQLKEIEEKTNALKEELKAELNNRNIYELQIKDHTIKYNVIISHRLDGSALKTSHPDIYESFLRPSVSRRFTVA